MGTPDTVEVEKKLKIPVIKKGDLLMHLYTRKKLLKVSLFMLIDYKRHWIACCSLTLLCPYLSRPCIKGSTGSTVDLMPHIASRRPGRVPQTRGIRHWMLDCRQQRLAGGRHGLKMQYVRHKVNSTGHSDHIESFVLLLLSNLKMQTHKVGRQQKKKKTGLKQIKNCAKFI